MRVTLTKEEAQGEVLQGGEHGPGRQHEADVEIEAFEWPAEQGAPWNRDGRFGHFKISITPPSGRKHLLDFWCGPEALKRNFSQVCGGFMEKDAEGNYVFDNEEIVGAKISGVLMGEPREGDERTFDGYVKKLLGEGD